MLLRKKKYTNSVLRCEKVLHIRIALFKFRSGKKALKKKNAVVIKEKVFNIRLCHACSATICKIKEGKLSPKASIHHSQYYLAFFSHAYANRMK